MRRVDVGRVIGARQRRLSLVRTPATKARLIAVPGGASLIDKAIENFKA